MTYSDIAQLRKLFEMCIKNIDGVWESKNFAAQAKNLGYIEQANNFLDQEKEFEEVLLGNLSTIIRYVKINMDVKENAVS